jgi:hypothetical protein
MTVEEFKSIFWWEWAHRLIARGIGVIFALPLFYFWATGKIERRLRWPLIGILALGGLQGAIGWWMVSSGLSVRTDVSQYRLATHLVMACLIFASCMWIMRGLSPHSDDAPPTRNAHLWAGVIAAFALFQIYLGALVAGLDAGFSYNTWPFMDGAVLPSDLLIQQPAWINFFENPKTVQFIHRVGAYTLFSLTLVNMIVALVAAPSTSQPCSFRCRFTGDCCIRPERWSSSALQSQTGVAFMGSIPARLLSPNAIEHHGDRSAVATLIIRSRCRNRSIVCVLCGHNMIGRQACESSVCFLAFPLMATLPTAAAI